MTCDFSQCLSLGLGKISQICRNAFFPPNTPVCLNAQVPLLDSQSICDYKTAVQSLLFGLLRFFFAVVHQLVFPLVANFLPLSLSAHAATTQLENKLSLLPPALSLTVLMRNHRAQTVNRGHDTVDVYH